MADPAFFEQAERLGHGGRPLVVCDVDEVALHFVRHLEPYLARKGFWLNPVSYGFSGNVLRAGTHHAATKEELRDLLHGFFAEESGRQEPVDGAAETLGQLAGLADVVFLTNMPHEYRPIREKRLAELGMPYPVVTSEGPKGAATRHLAERARGPIVFLDDAPSNVTSVRDAGLDDLWLIHFVADDRFRKLTPHIPGVRFKTGDWQEVWYRLELELG